MLVETESLLETYFAEYRKNIVGINERIITPDGVQKPIVYADWTASGRMYAPIEKVMLDKVYPCIANTHTDTNTTGEATTLTYHEAQHIIKKHVNADQNDVLITCGSGMTGVVNKFQRILGIKVHERFKDQIQLPEEDRPIVFITHMEHHSNQTSWLETLADVEIIHPNEDGMPDVNSLIALLEQYKNRKQKIASVTAASNVTGIKTDYHQIAKVMHQNNGLCFVDFACAAPYVNINMHPESEGEHLDAIFFSPHKFLGGPGTSGVLIFNKSLYSNTVPDHPGGGTVKWTNPWKEHAYFDNIEEREDGGTPAFLQAIRTALSIRLKEKMGVEKMLQREEELGAIIWEKLEPVSNLHLLADNIKLRLGVYSFYIDGLHYNLGVKLLNDKFGIQTRGGCSCAGTYGHYLLNVDQDYSHSITTEISEGNCSNKPGWIRMSIHPTMTDEEIIYICNSIKDIAENFRTYLVDYDIDFAKGYIRHKNDTRVIEQKVKGIFDL